LLLSTTSSSSFSTVSSSSPTTTTLFQTATTRRTTTTRRAAAVPEKYRTIHTTAVALKDDDDDEGGDRRDRGGGTTTTTASNDDDDDNNKKKKKTNDSDTAESELLLLEYEGVNIDSLDPDEIRRILRQEEAELLEEERSESDRRDRWKPGMRKRPPQSAIELRVFEQLFAAEGEEGADKRQLQPWTLREKRCGALAIKLGMLPVFDAEKWGVRYPCTALWLDSNVVLGHKTYERHGYAAVQVAAGARKRKNVGKSVLGQYRRILSNGDDNDEQQQQHPPYLVREFRVSDASHLVPVGSRIHARHFVPGQNVDVAATSKGKGFQGAMKRHNFKGMPASHGVSKSHRALGSTGACQDPGKVWKGKKMAGRMGGTRVTVQNLRVVKIDRARNVLYVLGAVPGNKGAFVEIRDAVKKPLWGTDLVADGADRPPVPTFEYDDAVDGIYAAAGTAASPDENTSYEEFMPLPQQDPLLSGVEEAA